MAEAIEKSVKIGGTRFPGFIQTELDDIDFLQEVLKYWAQYPENEVEALIENASVNHQLTDECLKSEGFDAEMNFGVIVPPSVTLIKLREGKWVIPGMEFEELEEFVEACERNIN